MFVIVPVLFVYTLYVIWCRLFPAPRISLSTPRWVLITGCDTGFGASLATRLHNMGYHVIAGCLTQTAVTSYQSLNSPRMLPIQLDVTRDEDISRAREFLRQHAPALHALVNNAGIGDGWVVDANSMETYRRVAAVNLFGGIAMTKMCIPCLLQAKESRVVTVTSLAGLVCLPGMSAYAASKSGMEAFMDSFRREMRVFGISASIIEPAFMSTPIVTNAAEVEVRAWNGYTEEVKQRWGQSYFNASVVEDMKQTVAAAENPEKAVEDMVDAVTSTKPHIRYRPGWQAKILFPISLLPGAVQDWFAWILTGRDVHLPAYVIQARQDKSKQG